MLPTGCGCSPCRALASTIVKTRTLMLLSVVCGLLIVLAGGIKLFQVASDRTDIPVLSVGDRALVGDMTVVVESIEPSPDGVAVAVSMSGVPGEVALGGWSMLGDGELLDPVDGGDSDTCDRATVVPEGGATLHCALQVPAADAVQYVAYQRGGELRRWAP